MKNEKLDEIMKKRGIHAVARMTAQTERCRLRQKAVKS